MGFTTSTDLKNGKQHKNNPVIPTGGIGSYNRNFSADGKVFYDQDHWVMTFFVLVEVVHTL